MALPILFSLSRIYVGFVDWSPSPSALKDFKLPVEVAAVAVAAAAWPAGNYRYLTGGKFSRSPGRCEPSEPPLTTDLTAIRHAQLLLHVARLPVAKAKEEHSGVNRPPANCRPWLPWWIARDSRETQVQTLLVLGLSGGSGTSHKSRTFYLPERMRRPFKAASWVCKLLLPLPVSTRFPAATLWPWQWLQGSSSSTEYWVLADVLVVAIALGHFQRGCGQGKCNMKPLSAQGAEGVPAKR